MSASPSLRPPPPPLPHARPAPCRLFAFAALFATIALPLLPAQTATDLNEGLALQPLADEPGSYQVSWWGRAGRTYFLQHSFDLGAPWSYFPIIETGRDGALSYGFASTAPRVFVRLRYLENTYADPYALDSDGDGLTNQEELTLETDPLSADTDGDGLPDKWEVDHGLDPEDPADALADPDGDGRPTAQEFLEGTDPITADASPAGTGIAPGAPTGLAVEELSSGALRLQWTAGGGGPVLGYLVERSSDYRTWQLVGFTSGPATSYDDTKALPNTAYAYRVKGVY